MWLPSVNCILLACIATTLVAEEARPKRDLQFLKDVIAAKLGIAPAKPVQNEERIKIVRVPDYEQVVVKTVPKVTVVEAPIPERIMQVDPTLAVIGSYLGTKTAEETLFALQGMKHLMHSGVMSARQEVIEMTPPKQPIYILPPQILQQKIEWPQPRPIYPIIEKTVVPIAQPMPMPILQPQPMPVLPPVPVLPPRPVQVIPPPAKVVVEEIKPVPMRPLVPLPPPIAVPVVPTRYLYKQVNTDGTVTTYLSEANQDVIITETNKPPPPPPPFIIERLQKIVYGHHLGNAVPGVPVSFPGREIGEIVVGPFVPKPLMPIITEPSDVEVTVNHTGKTHGESKVQTPSTTTIVQEKIVLPKPIDGSPLLITPTPIIFEEMEDEDEGPFYKHVHADGSVTTYHGTLSDKEQFSTIHFENFPELPPPPLELLQNSKTSKGQSYKPKAWGYALKMSSDGDGSYESLNGGKIYYSRLEPLPNNPGILPDPLSSLTGDEVKSPNKNVIMVGVENEDLDEFGKPFISTRVSNEAASTARPEIEPIKKMPPLPMPIAGETHKGGIKFVGGAKYSFKIENNPNSPDESKYSFSSETLSSQTDLNNNSNEYHGFGSEGFSYTQVNHDGTVETFTGTGKETSPSIALEPVKKIPALPAPIVVEHPVATPPTITINVDKEHRPNFSYTQFNKEGSVTSISEDRPVNIHAPVIVAEAVPVQPTASIDIIQHVPKGPCKSKKVCKKPTQPSEFSYTQVNNEGSVTKFTGHKQVKIPVGPEVPLPPVDVVDVIQPFPPPPPVFVEVSENKESDPTMFAKPVWSNYVYKQISHTNPKPFTVVKVGDMPDIEVPAGDVQVKVNKHEHVRPDGTTYPCTEIHKVAPDAPIPPLPIGAIVSTVPEGLIYVPPSDADAPILSTHKVEVKGPESHFSYNQVSSGSTTEASTTEVSNTGSSSDEPTSFNLNPIVVAPVESNYSFTQKHSDGSSINVHGDKDNSVSVTLEDAEAKTSDLGRGDIPEALE